MRHYTNTHLPYLTLPLPYLTWDDIDVIANNFLWSRHQCHFMGQSNSPSTQSWNFIRRLVDALRLKFVYISLLISIWQSANYYLSVAIHTCSTTWPPLTQSNLVTSLHPIYFVITV